MGCWDPISALLGCATLGKLLNLCNLVFFYKMVTLPLKLGIINLKGCQG